MNYDTFIPQTLLKTKAYDKAVQAFLDTDEQRDFKSFLGSHPDTGDIIPEDGLRKIRWSSSGHGKRGDARVFAKGEDCDVRRFSPCGTGNY